MPPQILGQPWMGANLCILIHLLGDPKWTNHILQTRVSMEAFYIRLLGRTTDNDFLSFPMRRQICWKLSRHLAHHGLALHRPGVEALRTVRRNLFCACHALFFVLLGERVADIFLKVKVSGFSAAELGRNLHGTWSPKAQSVLFRFLAGGMSPWGIQKNWTCKEYWLQMILAKYH